MIKNKKGQVWVETVTYTLVALVLIGLVLTYAEPKVEELQNQIVVEQSIEMLNQIDSVVQEIREGGIGNKRKIELNLNKGELKINSINDSIIYTLEGNYVYSEPGKEFYEGSFKVLTTEKGKNHIINITKEYNGLNITYSGKDEEKTFLKSASPYVIYVSNKGGAIPVIDFEL